MATLPTPVTVQDEYLAAILAELRAIRAQLSAQEPEPLPAGEVALREPAKRKRR